MTLVEENLFGWHLTNGIHLNSFEDFAFVTLYVYGDVTSVRMLR